MIQSARIRRSSAASMMSGYARPRAVGIRSTGTFQSAASSARSAGALELADSPGRQDAKPASRVPIALHWPVIENGAAPARPMLPVMSARLLIALTVSVPFVL